MSEVSQKNRTIPQAHPHPQSGARGEAPKLPQRGETAVPVRSTGCNSPPHHRGGGQGVGAVAGEFPQRIPHDSPQTNSPTSPEKFPHNREKSHFLPLPPLFSFFLLFLKKTLDF
jgi:hypothetical protein